jgi:hypothetical protein
MNLFIFTSEPLPWARMLRFYAASCVLLLLLVAIVLIGLDPYDSGRLAFAEGYGVPSALGPRLTAASTARAPDAEAAIIGNSTIQLLHPARLSELTGMRFVSLAIAGTGPTEQLAVARWFLRYHPAGRSPKAFVFSLDLNWCEADGRLTIVNPFPFWLYSPSTVEYALNMLRLKTFESAERKVKLMLGRTTPLRPDGYRDYETGHDWDKVAADRAFGETQGDVAVPDPPDFAAAALLREFVGALPTETQVLLLFPPRHVSSLPPPGSAGERIEAQCKTAYRAVAAARQRTIVVDLAIDGDIARNDQDFWDKVHYRGPVAAKIENAVASALQVEAAD